MLHLVRRFFSFGRARPLTDSETDAVTGWLPPLLADLFFEQPVADQRHGYDCAAWLDSRSVDPWMIQSGLLHDVGKRRAGLGRWGRAVATVTARLGMIPTESLRLYTVHGETGATELAEAGADVRTVTYTAFHHGRRPPEIAADDWLLLDEADRRN